MAIIGIIPAHLDSKRLPRKVLLAETGKPVIQHVYERAKQSTCDELYVVTYDHDIADAARSFGADIIGGKGNNGTERCAFVAELFDPDDIIVNIQSDNPELNPEHITLAVNELNRCDVGTVVTPIRDQAELRSAHVVKCVLTEEHRAMYFSRSIIPYSKWDYGGSIFPECYRHIGIYAFRPLTLLKYAAAYSPVIESLESLEQLRWLYHGMTIGCAIVEHAAHSIDTPDDYRAFVERYRHE